MLDFVITVGDMQNLNRWSSEKFRKLKITKYVVLKTFGSRLNKIYSVNCEFGKSWPDLVFVIYFFTNVAMCMLFKL